MTILCYHAVDPDWTSPLAVTPAAFEAHAGRLARTRTVLPLDEAMRRVDRHGRLPRGSTALTFDDGFESLYEHALPVLTRYRLPATVFIVAETLLPSGREVDWVDTPPPAPRRLTTLDRSQVREMQQVGVRFASHSFSHFDLTQLGYEACVADLARSREVLADVLGEQVDYLAYPRGRNDPTVRAAAAAAGYKHSFTLPDRSEPVDAHGVPRVGVYPGNGPRVVNAKSDPAYLRVRLGPAFPLLRRGAAAVGAAPRPFRRQPEATTK